MTRDRVIGEPSHERRVTVRRRVLKRADADMARRDADEQRAGQLRLARDVLAGRDDRERPSRRDAERVHRLADHVLAQHRTDRCLAIAAARERRATRALQVQIATPAVDVEQLAEQQRAAIAEAPDEHAELVTGVRLCHRRRARGRGVADEHGDAGRRSERIGIDAQLGGQLLVERQQARSRRGRGLPRHVQAFQLTNVRVVEREQRRGGDAHEAQANAQRSAVRRERESLTSVRARNFAARRPSAECAAQSPARDPRDMLVAVGSVRRLGLADGAHARRSNPELDADVHAPRRASATRSS